MLIKQCCSGGKWLLEWELYFIIYKDKEIHGTQLDPRRKKQIIYRGYYENYKDSHITNFNYED